LPSGQQLVRNNPMRGKLGKNNLIQEPKLRRVATFQPPPERHETFLAENQSRSTVGEASCVRMSPECMKDGWLGLGAGRGTASSSCISRVVEGGSNISSKFVV